MVKAGIPTLGEKVHVGKYRSIWRTFPLALQVVIQVVRVGVLRMNAPCPSHLSWGWQEFREI